MSLYPTRALLAQNSIPFPTSIAAAIGRCGALVLQQLHYWLQKSKRAADADGLKWIYNTLPQWSEQLGYSVSHLKRVFAHLQQLELIRIEKRQSIEWKQINWYAIDYDRLEKWLKPLLLSNGSFWADRSAHNEPFDQPKMSHSFTETTNTDLPTTNTPARPPVVAQEISDPSEPDKHETPFEGSATKSIGEQSPNEATDLGEGHSSAAAEPPILAEVREAIAPAPLHPQLKQQVLSYSVEAIREAIAVVESQKQEATVRKPVGLFVSALKREWVANRDESTPKTAPSGFGAWFDLARSAGIVVASQMIDGLQHVMRATADGELLLEPWEPLRAAYPVDRLRRILNGLE